MKKLFMLLSILAQVQFADATELYSRRLENTIKWGKGDLNLMRHSTGDKIITAAQLEAFRQDNNGKLVFAVDVNESGNASETRDSQGVAIESASIDVRIDGVVHHFDEFSTQTQSSLAKYGTTARQFYYTLIGDASSSHITNNSDVASMDATLSIPVNIDLSRATSAYVHFRFVNVNPNLGDPEAYYDFTGGYEDVGLLTHADAITLDTLAPGRAGAPLVVPTQSACTICSYAYYPSSTEYYLAAYEDQYPKIGDYDFNDLLVAYRISYGLDTNGMVKTINGEGYLLARGSSYNLDWYLHMPLPVSATGTGLLQIFAPKQTTPMAGYPQNFSVNGALNLKVFNDLRFLFTNPNRVQVNTVWNAGYIQGHKFKFNLTLNNSINPNQIGAPPYYPYIFVKSTGYEVHLPGKTALLSNSLNVSHNKTTFIDAYNFPYALIVPSDWIWTNEYVDIRAAYPQFVNFVNSGNTTNLEWYKSQNAVGSGLTKFSNRWQW